MTIKEIYPHGFPTVFVPEELRFMKIPIHNCERYVYMRPNEMYSHNTNVIVVTELFLEIWDDSPKVADPPFQVGIPYASTPELWEQDRKVVSGFTESHFSEGINNPVPFAAVSMLRSGKLYLVDGITRTLWLLIHKAKAFPLSCPPEYAAQLLQLAGHEQKAVTIVPTYPRSHFGSKLCKFKQMFDCVTQVFKK